MGLFNRKKRGVDEGERYYRMSLDNPEQALEYLQKSVELGNIHGKAKLARYYYEHEPQNKGKMQTAARLMQEAEAGGALLDDKLFICICDAAGEYAASFARRTKLAEAGDKDEQFTLGLYYKSGKNGTPVDLDKAWYWYGKAAEQNHAGAINNMSLMSLKGESVQKDEEQAVSLMITAAEAGSATACGNLAWNYYDGREPFGQDYEKALRYAQEGTKSGNQKSRYVLGLLKVNGLGTEQDIPAAVKIFRQLAKESYEDSETLYKKYRAEEVERRYNEIYDLIEIDPYRACEMFDDLLREEDIPIRHKCIDGKRAAEERINVLADEAFEKAKAAGDREGMWHAAWEMHSRKGCAYLFSQAAAASERAVHLGDFPYSDEELDHLADFHWIARINHMEPSADELKKVLSMVYTRASQLMEQNKKREVRNRLSHYRHFNDPLCQCLLADAYYNGTWEGEEKALAVLEEAVTNPEIHKEQYSYLLKLAQKNIAVYKADLAALEAKQEAEHAYYEELERVREREKERATLRAEYEENLSRLDNRERMFNALLNNNTFTNEENYLAGNLSDEEYMRRKFLRDQKEDRYRREYEDSLRSLDDE